MKVAEVRDWIVVLKQHRVAAAAEPTRRLVWAAGDFNFLPHGEPRESVLEPGRSRDLHVAMCLSHSASVINDELKYWTEISTTEATHFSAASSTLSRLDTIYTALPPWAISLLRTRAAVPFDPYSLSTRCISDHPPTSVAISSTPSLPEHLRPIPASVFRLPSFQYHYDILLDAAN